MNFPNLKKINEIDSKKLEIIEANRYFERLTKDSKKIDCLIDIQRLQNELIILLENERLAKSNVINNKVY